MFEGIFNKKFFLATFFALAIIIIWDVVFLKDIREQEKAAKALKESQQAIIKNNSPTENVATDNTAVEKEYPRVTINNKLMSGSMSLQGARIDDISLLHYRETLEENSPNIKIFNFKNTENAYFFESGWLGSTKDNQAPNSQTLWKVEGNASLTINSPIKLIWKNQNGITYKKEISIDENYLITIKDVIENNSNNTIEVTPFALILRHNDPNVEDLFISHEGFVGYLNNVLERVDYSDTLEKKYEYKGYSTYLGFTDKYWLATMLLDDKDQISSRFLSFKDNKNINNYQADYKGAVTILESGQSKANITRLFVGPKEYNLIKQYNDDFDLQKFDDTIDFGWFFFFTKPMIMFLLWIYHMVGGFGVAILIFTIVVRLIIFPIAYKSYISMARLKELQPKMKELKEKYGSDMQKYNKEIVELYKKEKINPLSGCFPILLQIPIFFSIYKVIFISIEMRHEPFFGWINDMSVKDPTNLFNLFGLFNYTTPAFLHIGIWPILMGVTMYFQQKISTTQVLDGLQQKILNMMPIVLAFVLAAFPSGLVIYWTWSNIISIIQQFFINKKIHKELLIKNKKKLK